MRSSYSAPTLASCYLARPAHVHVVAARSAAGAFVELHGLAVDSIGERRRHRRNLSHEPGRRAARDGLAVGDEMGLIGARGVGSSR